MSSKRNSGKPGWGWRRAIIFPVVAFALWRLMAMESAVDTSVNETIAWGWIMLIAALVLGYTGIATAQDVAAIMATKSSRPYKEPEPEIDQAQLPIDQRAG